MHKLLRGRVGGRGKEEGLQTCRCRRRTSTLPTFTHPLSPAPLPPNLPLKMPQCCPARPPLGSGSNGDLRVLFCVGMCSSLAELCLPHTHSRTRTSPGLSPYHLPIHLHLFLSPSTNHPIKNYHKNKTEPATNQPTSHPTNQPTPQPCQGINGFRRGCGLALE